jgi:predicted nucleic acid-binding protein
VVGAYLDASVLASLLLEEATSDQVDRWLSEADRRLVVSDLASAEVSSAVSLAVRTQQEDVSGGRQLLADFDAWLKAAAVVRVDINPGDIRTADHFVRRFELKLRTPDAIHAAVAQRLGATLITLDRRLLRAASALGVEAISPAGPE